MESSSNAEGMACSPTETTAFPGRVQSSSLTVLIAGNVLVLTEEFGSGKQKNDEGLCGNLGQVNKKMTKDYAYNYAGFNMHTNRCS